MDAVNALDNPADNALGKAKYHLLKQGSSVFLSTILFSLKFEWTTEVPTAATNGIHLYINPDFFTSLKPKEQIGLLAHEAWHVAFQHMVRLGNRDLKRWNIAADYVINNMLIKGKYELPPRGLIDNKYNGMSTEEVYNLLPETLSPTEEAVALDVKIPDKESHVKVDQQVQKTLAKAATQAKMAKEAFGDLPSDISIAIGNILNPKLNWTTVLRNYMNQFDKSDYSMKKPNKRFLPAFYLPSLHSESVANIAIAVDSSGSVSDEEFTAFITEIESIRKSLCPKEVSVIAFDTKVVSEVILRPADSIKKVTFSGRGGTTLQPVFDHYKKIKPTVLIVFSDLECRPMTDKPNYPVIWIGVNLRRKPVINFGKLIELTL